MMQFGNILSHIYNQIGPVGKYVEYTCRGYLEDSKALEFWDKVIEKSSVVKDSEVAHREAIKKCLSDVGNVIGGSDPHSNDPSLGMYISIGVGVAAAAGALAYYLKSKNSQKTTH